jgi:hypothetical protein
MENNDFKLQQSKTVLTVPSSNNIQKPYPEKLINK